VRITETLIAGAILVCVLAGSARAGAPDACELRFPKVLARGDACTLVAIADFDGDGSLDVAAVMPSRRDASPLLVASLYRGGSVGRPQSSVLEHDGRQVVRGTTPAGHVPPNKVPGQRA